MSGDIEAVQCQAIWDQYNAMQHRSNTMSGDMGPVQCQAI